MSLDFPPLRYDRIEMPTSHAEDLTFAVDLAGQAGKLLMRSYEQVLRVDRKSKRDVVTDVDYASEGLVIDAIRARYPGDAILAEESGRHESAETGKPLAASLRARWSRRTWVIDPLDGTVNYANGIPFFCVAIALVEGGRPVVGVIHDPMRGETFAATEDGPAMLDGLPIEVSTKDRLSDFVMSVDLAGPALVPRARSIRKAIRIARSMGSAALALAYVGNGRFDAMYQHGGLSLWDVAAAGLIAERAGATLSDPAGGPWFDISREPRTVGVLAAPASRHAEVLQLLRGRPRGPRRENGS